jgi:hypothetical protein
MAHQVKPRRLRAAGRRRVELQPDRVAKLNQIGERRVHKGQGTGFAGNRVPTRAVAHRPDRCVDGVKVCLRPRHNSVDGNSISSACAITFVHPFA